MYTWDITDLDASMALMTIGVAELTNRFITTFLADRLKGYTLCILLCYTSGYQCNGILRYNLHSVTLIWNWYVVFHCKIKLYRVGGFRQGQLINLKHSCHRFRFGLNLKL